MVKQPNDTQEVPGMYDHRAISYDHTLKTFDIFARLGFNISGWRSQAISALNLKPGDTVIDIGSGTGLNFPFLHQAVGPQGKIIGIDLSAEMLAQAQQKADENHWTNIHLACMDASRFEFPQEVNAILSTYTLILVPDCGRVVSSACQALMPGGRLVVFDMAWPRYCPLWWRHVLFFLRSYGVTKEVIRRRPWDTVQKVMTEHLQEINQRKFWFGFFDSPEKGVKTGIMRDKENKSKLGAKSCASVPAVVQIIGSKTGRSIMENQNIGATIVADNLWIILKRGRFPKQPKS